MRATFVKVVMRLVVVGVVALACGRGASSTDTPSAVVATVGPAGGFVAGPGVTVAIPPGALGSDVAITVSDDGVPPAGYEVTGKVYRFRPAGLRFAVPVTVTMPGAAPSRMFWTLEGSEDRFAALATRYGSGETKADVTHFSSGFVGIEVVAPDAAVDAPPAAPPADASCGVTGTWPIDAGGAGVCPPSSAPVPACPTCTVSEEVYCDTVCPVVNGPTRCVDSKTDPKHCGGCFAACGANEVCNEGICAPSSTVRFIDAIGAPRDIASDAKNIYFTESVANEVWQVDKIAGVRTKLAPSAGRPNRLVLDSTHVYWSDLDGAIMRAPIGGATPAEVVQPASSPHALAVDGSHVFWSGSPGGIHKAPKEPGCGPPVLLTTASAPHDLDIDATRLYAKGGACSSPVDPTIIGIDKVSGAKTGYSGCEGIRIGYFTSVGIDSSSVLYFDERGTANITLIRKDKNGGATTTRKLCNAECTTAPYARFVVDGCGLYWAIDRSIWRLLPDDTRLRRISWAVTVSSAGSLPRRVAVDDKYVYWTDETFIGRTAK